MKQGRAHFRPFASEKRDQMTEDAEITKSNEIESDRLKQKAFLSKIRIYDRRSREEMMKSNDKKH